MKSKNLLLLHGGMGMDSSYFDTKGINLLDEAGIDTYTYDQRGNGEWNENDPTKLTIQQWSEDIPMMAEKFNLEDYALLGHSYGGFVALNFAATYSNSIRKLIVVNSKDYSYTFFNNPGAAEDISESDKEMREKVRRKWPSYFASGTHYEIFERIKYNARTAAAGKREMVKMDLRPKLSAIKADTLLIIGEEDERYLERNLEMKDLIPNSTLEIIPNCKHFPFIEQPEIFAKLVINFLKE